jgi:hypothetical protein
VVQASKPAPKIIRAFGSWIRKQLSDNVDSLSQEKLDARNFSGRVVAELVFPIGCSGTGIRRILK